MDVESRRAVIDDICSIMDANLPREDTIFRNLGVWKEYFDLIGIYAERPEIECDVLTRISIREHFGSGRVISGFMRNACMAGVRVRYVGNETGVCGVGYEMMDPPRDGRDLIHAIGDWRSVNPAKIEAVPHVEPVTAEDRRLFDEYLLYAQAELSKRYGPVLSVVNGRS